jgi:hypothetical protein
MVAGSGIEVNPFTLVSAVNVNDFSWSLPMSATDGSAFIKSHPNRSATIRIVYSVTRTRKQTYFRSYFVPFIYSVDVFADESLTRKLGSLAQVNRVEAPEKLKTLITTLPGLKGRYNGSDAPLRLRILSFDSGAGSVTAEMDFLDIDPATGAVFDLPLPNHARGHSSHVTGSVSGDTLDLTATWSESVSWLDRVTNFSIHFKLRYNGVTHTLVGQWDDGKQECPACTTYFDASPGPAVAASNGRASAAAATATPSATANAQTKGLDQALLAKANAGDVASQRTVGFIYVQAIGVQKDYAQAATWFRKAAGQGDMQSQTLLGMLYHKGLGIPRDDTQAAALFLKAAGQGDPVAQHNLGSLYYEGQGVPQDSAQAELWWRKAAEQGNAPAQFDLGMLYSYGKGVSQDYAQAASWLRKSAEQGNAHAQNSLGVRYQNGQGVSQDYAQAAIWYRKAAEKGDVEAQNSLGVLYYKGQGVPQDYTQAETWVRKAAEQGFTKAQLNLGLFFYSGKGIPQNNTEAYFWLNVAAAGLTGSEHDKIVSVCDKIAAQMTPTDLSAAQNRAATWLANHPK